MPVASTQDIVPYATIATKRRARAHSGQRSAAYRARRKAEFDAKVAVRIRYRKPAGRRTARNAGSTRCRRSPI